jgi:hypothetical protein
MIANKGAIIADGGEIYLTTSALDTVLNGLVNNTGIIQANSVEEKDGKIILFAHGGTGEFGGTITTGNGEGFVETSGKVFENKEDLQVSTGSWLIDPTDLTVDSNLAGTISTTLNGGADVTQTATGNINVNSAIAWNTAKIFTLHADNNIYINENITASNAAGKLTLEYGQGAVASGNTAKYSIASGKTINLALGQNFSTKLGSDGTTIDYTVINTKTALQDINNNKSGNFALGSDIDASGGNWTPIGNYKDDNNHFTGKFDGLGHTVSNLSIIAENDSDQQGYGLFGSINQATLKNLTLSSVSINSKNYFVGALVGIGQNSIIDNITSSGWTVTNGEVKVGGLAGAIEKSTIDNSSSSVNVSGSQNIGGLVGSASDGSTISNSFATGTVEATTQLAGGLVGLFWDGTLTNSYATGTVSVTGGRYAGGLIGRSGVDSSQINIISNVYATGNVSGIRDGVGGLIGRDDGSTISKAHATGSVGSANTRGDYSGGLIGGLLGGSLSDSYATGKVYGKEGVGELIGGTSSENISRVYATGNVDAISTYAGGLIGMQYVDKTEIISDVYATGNVTSTANYVGGLIGFVMAEDRAENKSLSISNSYATGNVATTDNDGATAGRFIGDSMQFDGLTISNSFYSTNSTVALPSGSSETTGFGVEKSATEFKKLSTFSGDGWTWNMTTDSTLNKNTILSPTLVADNQGVMHWVMPLYTTALNYTLATANTTYNGLDQALSGFWTNSIFGSAGSSLVAGTDYKFVYGSADTTSFKNAGIYNSISVQLLNSDYELDTAGTNTVGSLVIAKANATVTAENKSKTSGESDPILTYNIIGLVGNDTLDGLLSRISGESVGNYNITKGTLANSNYAIDFTKGNFEIKKNETIAKVVDNIVPPIPTPPPSTPSTSDGRTKEKTTTVVTTTTPSGSIAAPTVQATDVTALVKLVVPALSGSTSEFTIVSQANNTEVSKVTMEELTTKAPNSEIRVALGEDSLVALVNGGVNLPDGVSQEFYVVEEK